MTAREREYRIPTDLVKGDRVVVLEDEGNGIDREMTGTVLEVESDELVVVALDDEFSEGDEDTLEVEVEPAGLRRLR